MDSLGDRMKTYEAVSSCNLTRRIPVIIRVDGRAFHNYLRKAQKPFDSGFIESMFGSVLRLAEEIQGFKLAYVQSDEASFLLTDYDKIETSAYFDYSINKLVSISASLMTGYFNVYAARYNWYKERKGIPANFDARTFNIPKEDVANYFLWRTKDWERNSLQMYARSFFSHKQLHRKNKEAIHELLHSIGKNWSKDLNEQIKNGTFIWKDTASIKSSASIKPTYAAISKLVDTLV